MSIATALSGTSAVVLFLPYRSWFTEQRIDFLFPVKEKSRRGRKPVSVFEFVIYLRNLPPGIGRAALIYRYIWSCRPRDRTRHTLLRCVVSSCLAFSPLPTGATMLRRYRRLFSVTAAVKLLPPELSSAGCPFLSGLSSAHKRRDESSLLIFLQRYKKCVNFVTI